MADANIDKISIKDLHQTFWRGRDFELSNLWQRSIFLTAFLVLVFTAYGTLLSKIFDVASSTDKFIHLNFVAYLLSILGIIFSIMWIKMGKASKAWYEAYESAIDAFEGCFKFADGRIAKYGGFSYNKLPGYKGFDIDNGLLSGKAGEFSSSKINIGIGQVFFGVWSMTGISHAIVISECLEVQTALISYFVLFGLAVPAVLAIWFFGRRRTFKSSSIKDYSEKKADFEETVHPFPTLFDNEK